MKKFCFLGLLALLILFIPISISAGGLLSPAISVLQEEVQIIKTGVGTNTVSFASADFFRSARHRAFPWCRDQKPS